MGGGVVGGMRVACRTMGHACCGEERSSPLCCAPASFSLAPGLHRLYCLYRSKMEMKDKLYFTDLAVPPGASLHRVNTALPILKLAK